MNKKEKELLEKITKMDIIERFLLMFATLPKELQIKFILERVEERLNDKKL